MKRFATAIGIIVLLSSTAALAHQCFVVSKPTGAGSAGVATLELNGFEYDTSGVNYTKSGKPKGGFVTDVVTLDGAPVATVDTFSHGTLPSGALNSGPGETECDGVGIDDAAACL